MGFFRGFLDRGVCLAITTAALWFVQVSSCCGDNAPSVVLEQGLVHGFQEKGTNVFLGIPFAETTGGQNRWKAPQRMASSQTAEYNATQYGPSCAQAMSGDSIVAQSEDCLNLNVGYPLNPIQSKTNDDRSGPRWRATICPCLSISMAVRWSLAGIAMPNGKDTISREKTWSM